MIIEAIALGLIVNLFFSEILGFSAGGMIVLGYIAFMLHYPLRILTTIVVSLLTYFVVRFLSNFMLIYGKRHTVIVIIIGFILGELSKRILSPLNISMESIGYIIPGLIAMWMGRQGIIQTIILMLIGAIIVWMILIILTQGYFFI